MRHSRFGLRTAVILAGLILPLPPAGLTCSCFAVAGRKALPTAAAMFTGKATIVEFLETDTKRNEPAILVTFEVLEVWKGPVQETLRLRTIYNRWTCGGYYFKEGETYLVTAHQVNSSAGQDDIELGGVNPCGGTRELDKAAEVLRDLGPGEKPEQAPRMDTP